MLPTYELGGVDVLSSARAGLIPRVQVLDVLKNLNIREGMFSEEEIKQLENGYSVSESDADDMVSMNSGDSHGMGSLHSPASHDWGHRGGQIEEARIRHTQERSILQAEIAREKTKNLKRVGQLERMLDRLKDEKRQMQLVLETERQNFKLQLLQQEQKTQDQLAVLRENQARLQGQVPQFKEKLDMYKKELSQLSLLVSEETYVELKAKPEEQRSLKEYIQVRVYEQVEKHMRETEHLRLQNGELGEEIMGLRLKGERETRELESLKKLSREREEDFRRKNDGLERRVRELEQDLHRANMQHKVLIEKGSNLREVDELHRQLEIDHKTLQTQHKMLEDQMSRVQEMKLEAERRADSLRREIDLLNQDKTFLTRENAGLEERLKRLEDKLDRTEAELSDAKRTTNKYMEKVLATSDDVKGKFEQQYSLEVADLKERHAKELESTKQNLIEIYEKRIEYLKELKDSFERRVLKLEQDMSDKTKSYEELLVEYRQLQKTTDEDIGRLKLAVASRGDEVQRIRHLYEDNMVMVKDLKIENEALKSKIDVLKSEYYKLEGTHRQGNADIKAEFAVCKERLANYELIEKELDQAIMNVANNESLEGDAVNSIGNALIQTITSAPTTAKRRIQQSLLLANRLQAKQKEVESLQKEINDLKQKIDNQEHEAKFAKRMLGKTNQPHSFMIAEVEKSEKELLAANKHIAKLQDELKRLNKENEALSAQKKGLYSDLQKLQARSQDVENLQTALQGIIMHSSAKKIDVDELRHKLAESIRGGQYKSQANTGKRPASRSKSPAKGFQYSLDEVPERGSAVKMFGEVDQQPAWYKVLKNKITK